MADSASAKPTNNSSDEFEYSSEDEINPKSMFDITKRGHIPGQYKRDPDAKEEQEQKSNVGGDEQESEKQKTVSSIVDSGIFGKSMVVIPSVSEDDLANCSKETKSPPPVAPKPVAPKPVTMQPVDTSLSSQLSDGPPTPKPRRRQMLSMSGIDGNKPRPVPKPRSRGCVKKTGDNKELSNDDDDADKGDGNKDRSVVFEFDVGNRDLAFVNDANDSDKLKELEDTEFAVSDSLMIGVDRDVKVKTTVEMEDINIEINVKEPSNDENVADKDDSKPGLSGSSDNTKVNIVNEYECGVSDSLMPDVERGTETESHVRNTGNEIEKLETVEGKDHIEQKETDKEPEDDGNHAKKLDYGTKTAAAVSDFDVNINEMNEDEYSVSDSIRVITLEDSRTNTSEQIFDPAEFVDGNETTVKPCNDTTSSFAVTENVMPGEIEKNNRNNPPASFEDAAENSDDLSDSTDSFKSLESNPSTEVEIFENSSSEVKFKDESYEKPVDYDSNKSDGEAAGPEVQINSSPHEMAESFENLNLEESIVVIQSGSFSNDIGHVGYKSIDSAVTSGDLQSFSTSERTSSEGANNSSFDILSQSGTSENFEEVFGDSGVKVVKASDAGNKAITEQDTETVDVLKRNDDVNDVENEQENMEKTGMVSHGSTKDSDECQQSVNEAAPPPIMPKSEVVLESLKIFTSEHKEVDSRYASQQTSTKDEETTETQPFLPPRRPNSDGVFESWRGSQSTEPETSNIDYSHHQSDTHGNQTNYAKHSFEGSTPRYPEQFDQAHYHQGMPQQLPFQQPLTYVDAKGQHWPMYQRMQGSPAFFQHHPNAPFQQHQPYWPYQSAGGYMPQPMYDNVNESQCNTHMRRPADRSNSPYSTPGDVSSDSVPRRETDPSRSKRTSTTKTPQDVSSDKVPKSETDSPSSKSASSKTPSSHPKPSARKNKPSNRQEKNVEHVYDTPKSTKVRKKPVPARSATPKEFCIQFKGISNITRPDTITNIIEIVTGIETDSDKVIINKSKECAWIILDTRPDLEKLKERIKKRGLDGSYPVVSEVPVSTIPSKQEKKTDHAKRESVKLEKTLAAAEKEEKAEHQLSLIFLKGINPDTKEENLRNFIETATKGTLDKIIYDYSKTCTLVTVNGDSKPDLAKLRNKVNTNGFDGYKPEIVEMPHPTSVAVSSLSHINSLEALGLYFESKKANGDIILKDPYESRDGTCYIVEFGNHEVVRRVCEKHDHKIDQTLLRVSPFYQCDVGEIWDAMLHTVTMPAAITVELDRLKIKFLQKKCCEDLLTILEGKFCKVTFTRVSVQLECLITPKVEGFKKLAEGWQDDARGVFDKYIEDTVKERTVVSDENVWAELMEYFTKEDYGNKDQLVASPCATSYKVEIVGFDESVQECSEKLESKHMEVKKRLNRRKSTFRKSALELELIKKLKVLEKVQDDIEDLSVEYDSDSITVEAQPDDINTVKLRMVEFSNEVEIRSWSHNWSTYCVQFVLQKLRPKISDEFEDKGIILSWEICDEAVDFCIYKSCNSTSASRHETEMAGMEGNDGDNISDTVIENFQKLIIEKHVACDMDNVDLFRSNEWTSFIETATETYEKSAELEVVVDNVYVYGLRSEVLALEIEVEQFLKENSVFKSHIDCKAIELKFMDKHRPGFLNDLENKYASKKLRLLRKGNKIEVHATKEGMKRAEYDLNKFQRSIVTEQLTVQRVAVKEVMRDEFEQGALDKIEKDTRCIIKLPDEDLSDSFHHVAHENVRPHLGLEATADARGNTRTISETTPSEFKATNGVTIKLVKGVLHEQDGDVMVVATAPNLNLSSGKACKSILQAAGQRLQEECKEKYPNDIKCGDIAVVHGCGELECNRVYFTTLPNWNEDAKQILKKVMTDSLEMASKHNKHSIMFSAMGTGQLRYPTDVVAMVMFESVIEFDKNNAGTTLKDVKFVLFKKDVPTIKAFEEEMKYRISGTDERPTYDYQTGPVKVQVVTENIAQQQVDAIFCATSKSMDLTHGACQALLRYGGKSLQEECKAKYNNEIDEGNIAEIGQGKLPCKCVFLTVLPHYGPDAMKLYLNVFKAMLQTCESKQLSSVAMPALGTGNLKYPRDEVCKTMFSAIDNWVRDNPSTCLRNVRFVMHVKDRDVIQTFQSYVRSAQGRGQRKGRNSLNASQAIISPIESPVRSSRYNVTDNSFSIGKIKLTVFIGDLLEQKSDVIVCSVGNDFDFIGGVSQALAKKCPSIVKECKKQEKVTKLQKKNVVRTGCRELAAKCVFHIKYTEILSEWRERIQSCLEKADRHNYKSVAFPVFGTGQAFKQFSPDDIAGCMFDAIDEYEKATKLVHVKDVRVIVFNRQPQHCEMIKRTFHRKIKEAVNPPDNSFPGVFFRGVQKLYQKIKGIDMKADQRKKIKNETSSMTLLIYSDGTENIKKCKTEIETKLEKMYSKKKVDDYTELVKKLTQEEKDMLDIAALVNINIDSNSGVITVEGPDKLVDEAKHEIQLRLLKIERARNEADNAEKLHGIVQWHYEEVMPDGSMEPKPYNKDLNFKIEEAYKGNKPEIRFQTGNKTYVIDFNKLVEYDKDDDKDTVRVIRKDILKEAIGALPDDWAPMENNKNLITVPLKPTDAKYQAIEQKFIQEVKSGAYSHRVQFSFNPNNVKVTKIERVQNKTLYQQYQAKKKHMSDQKPNLPQNMPIERDLWHGMKPDVIASIQNHGFNRSYSGDANGQPWYGDGVYFAGDASYSCRNWLTGAKPGTKSHVFLVNVLTGQFCKGQKGMRYLPVVDPAKPTVMYDSAVNDTANPYEFVIFNDTQAYPAYLVTFTS